MGRIAYEEYCSHTGGVSLVSGAKLPAWDDLDLNIAVAWTRAAKAVSKAALRALEESDGA